MNATVTTPQGPIAYREVGQGTPLVFVHGLLVDSRLWDGVVDNMPDGHRCIVANWPMGSHRLAMNDDADVSPPGLARIITMVMDELGIDRATIVGNNTGGAVSQILTAHHPERVERLVLTNCDTFEHFPPFPFNLLKPVAKLPGGMAMLQAGQRFAAVRRMSYAPLVKRPLTQELVDSWLEPASNDPEVRRDLVKILRGIDKRQTIAAAEKLRGFEGPVRFAWATDDRFFKRSHAERLAAQLQDARIEDIPGAGTFVPLDEPARVAELVAEFVAEDVAARA
jgi:pimeloyl-ACP methyl ester carboxylesterase